VEKLISPKVSQWTGKVKESVTYLNKLNRTPPLRKRQTQSSKKTIRHVTTLFLDP